MPQCHAAVYGPLVLVGSKKILFNPIGPVKEKQFA